MKFQVFRDGEVVEKFRPCGAYLFGTDGISIRRAKITVANGCIECAKPNIETAGLALLWPIVGGILVVTGIVVFLIDRKRPRAR